MVSWLMLSRALLMVKRGRAQNRHTVSKGFMRGLKTAMPIKFLDS